MKQQAAQARYLGVECGATRSFACLAGADDTVFGRAELGPANLQLLNDEELRRHLRSIKNRFCSPSAIAIGMAGARTAEDQQRIIRAAGTLWPGVPCHATNDLETALEAGSASPQTQGPKPGRTPVRVLILSGTGSCCYGRGPGGKAARVGGWGHLLGDRGSGYDIGLSALRAVVEEFDRSGRWPELGRRLLRALSLNEPDELIGWVKDAGKNDVAALAVEVFAAWHGGDELAARLLGRAREELASQGIACARRLARLGRLVEFVFSGSVLLEQRRFADLLGRELRRRWAGSVVRRQERESVWGAVRLARRHFPGARASAGGAGAAEGKDHGQVEKPFLHESLLRSPTEQRNPRSMKLDRLSMTEAVLLMLSEDAKIPEALRAERVKIERALGLIVRALRRGGRLFYTGAGTSGRLGVLDASECPPTFQTSPEMVQGIIAGGQRALWDSVEGAEDDFAAGARAMEFRGVHRRDVVVGIAASGRTPFVWGALGEARRRGAKTILLCFNPNLRVAARQGPDLVIAPAVGPEILTGSTRLKAGTATKLILNMFTTLAMVRLGKVRENLMVDVAATNLKLRDRAVRIVQELTRTDEVRARAALERAGWQVKEACARLGAR